MQIQSKLPLYLGLLLALAGIVMLLIHINYLVSHQNTDYMYLFYVGIGLNVIGISLYRYVGKRRKGTNA